MQSSEDDSELPKSPQPVTAGSLLGLNPELADRLSKAKEFCRAQSLRVCNCLNADTRRR